VDRLKESIRDFQSTLVVITDALITAEGDAADQLTKLRSEMCDTLRRDEAKLAELEATAADGEPSYHPAASTQPVPARGGRPKNAKIHPRSRYAAEEPDFAALAETYPSLQPYLLVRLA
jgi:hypothetical protein